MKRSSAKTHCSLRLTLFGVNRYTSNATSKNRNLARELDATLAQAISKYATCTRDVNEHTKSQHLLRENIMADAPQLCD